MTATVTALVVSHDGARWLPAVLDGLAEQSRPPDRVLAVDTGSGDDSAALLVSRLGPAAVLGLGPLSFGRAVAAGLQAAPASTGTEEWLWLLHDDSRPAPDALAALLEAASADPDADLLGPKLREWPSLRRLLEVGVTLSGTGRRETGLEPGEYDQGQHDRVREVLAVNTAGLLVRRSVLEELGFDPALPLFGTDLDLGWRAARAGHRTLVVPAAVVFHAEAGRRAARPGGPSAGEVRRAVRAGAVYTLLANCATWALPFMLLRLPVGSLLRALGLLLLRAPSEALDELRGLLAVYLRPDRLVAGRRRRAAGDRAARRPVREVRRLLAPPWTPYRHGLDFLSDVAVALTHQVGDLSVSRRERRMVEPGPVSEEAQNLPADDGWLARRLADPLLPTVALLVLAALVAGRGLYGGGLLSGGALLPAPGSSTHWWGTYLESTHRLGVGSVAPAAPYLLPLAVAGSVLLGKAWLVVDVLFLLAVPLAALGAHRFLRGIGVSRWSSLWGAVTYALLPVLGGAVQEGRLGTVAGALVLPWLARSATFLGPAHAPDRRWRAAWRVSLWLALLLAFVPVAWFLAAAAALTATLVVVLADRGAGRRRWLPLLVPPLVAPVLLLPWSVLSGGLDGWLLEAGLPVPELAGALDRWGALLGRPGGHGAPGWLTAGVLLAALAGLVRPDTRRRVLGCWVMATLGLALVTVLAPVRVTPLGSSEEQPVWLGFPVLLVQAALVCAAAIAGSGIGARFRGVSFGWRQPLGAAVVLLAVLTPLAGVGWWVTAGDGGPLDRVPPTGVPAYMTEAAALDPLAGVLVVRGSTDERLSYLLLRGPGVRLGDDSVLPPFARTRSLTEVLRRLAGTPEPADVETLAGHGVAFVYAPPPADPELAGNLDSLARIAPASALRPGSRAWQLEVPASDAALPALDPAPRTGLLLAQALALLAAAVLAAPTRKPER